ncbi:MAG: septum site-determining protein MinC [Deltaproteobacteria bacterium]|nr:MAG: septum site-determining protein MinC [Deltaproteobacteria bacterium]
MDDFSQSTAGPVKLKGVGEGFRLTVDPTQSRDVLEAEIRKIFDRLRHLTINAKVVIDPGGTEGYEYLIEALSRFLKSEYDVGQVTGPGRPRSAAVEEKRRRDVDQSWDYRKSDVLMLYGRVRSGQKVSTRKHLVILGDVNPGAEVIAGGDVLVMGKLAGMVHAGCMGDTGAIVLALDFRPTQIQIGDILAAGVRPKKKGRAEVARVSEDGIVVDDYLNSDPFGRIPWPEVR